MLQLWENKLLQSKAVEGFHTEEQAALQAAQLQLQQQQQQQHHQVQQVQQVQQVHHVTQTAQTQQVILPPQQQQGGSDTTTTTHVYIQTTSADVISAHCKHSNVKVINSFTLFIHLSQVNPFDRILDFITELIMYTFDFKRQQWSNPIFTDFVNISCFLKCICSVDIIIKCWMCVMV